jgi:hypothetical protein
MGKPALVPAFALVQGFLASARCPPKTDGVAYRASFRAGSPTTCHYPSLGPPWSRPQRSGPLTQLHLLFVQSAAPTGH